MLYKTFYNNLRNPSKTVLYIYLKKKKLYNFLISYFLYCTFFKKISQYINFFIQNFYFL